MRDLIQKIDNILNESREQRTGLFEIGDEFGISFSEDLEIATTIVGFVEDGIMVELDDTAIGIMESNGARFIDGYLEEGLRDPKDNPCWKGYKPVGTKKKNGKTVPNCVPKESVKESGLQYYTGKKKYGKDGMSALAKAGREGASEEELGRIKDKFKKEEFDLDEGKATFNFDAEDIARLQNINDLSTVKTQAFNLISKPSKRPMKPEKVEWFKNALERMQNKNSVIKLMYDLLLSGEGMGVIGSKSSMSQNSYRQRFGDGIESEQGVAEAEYQGRDVPLNKPMSNTDGKSKSKVYVKDPQTGNVKKVTFGDPNMRIKKSNPERRKSFRARHNCDNPGPKTKARYWSCRNW